MIPLVIRIDSRCRRLVASGVLEARMAQEKLHEDFEIRKRFESSDRAVLRYQLVNEFLTEKKGYWTEEGRQVVTRYKYFVETLQDGRQIYLSRPTFLNKGIDFTVVVERFDGVKDKLPSHPDLISDILLTKRIGQAKIGKLLSAIERVWLCEDPDEVLKDTDLAFKPGLSADLVLKALKWLFIEQDITYWNYDGRMMLWNGIRNAVQIED